MDKNIPLSTENITFYFNCDLVSEIVCVQFDTICPLQVVPTLNLIIKCLYVRQMLSFNVLSLDKLLAPSLVAFSPVSTHYSYGKIHLTLRCTFVHIALSHVALRTARQFLGTL